MRNIFDVPGVSERLLGMNHKQFQVTLGKFTNLLRDAHFELTVRGRSRTRSRQLGAWGGFKDHESMLGFVLFYYRWYPMQSALGTIFGMTQQWVSMWIKHLTPFASEALGYELSLPDRRPLSLMQLLHHEPDANLLSDPPSKSRRPSNQSSLEQAFEAAGF